MIWDLETMAVLRRHELVRPKSVDGLFEYGLLAFGSDEEAVIALSHHGALLRWPISGDPTVTPIVSSTKAVQFMGFRSGLSSDADQLPTANGRVLVQDERGALALISEAGNVVWKHRGAPAYCAKERWQSRASMSPSGNFIVAAVGAAAALAQTSVIEVFAADGSLLQSIPWGSGSEKVTDVAINDEGWVGLGTTKRLQIYPPIDPTATLTHSGKPATKAATPATPKRAASKRAVPKRTVPKRAAPKRAAPKRAAPKSRSRS